MGLRIFRVFAPVCFSPKIVKGTDPMNPEYSELECEPGQTYMRSDLSVNFDDPKYKTMAWFAYIFIFIYVIGIPAFYITILYMKRKIIAKDPDEEGKSVHPDDHQEVMKCRTEFGSMYKDYKRKYYWFELVEMIRKISLVGALVMLGTSGMQIFAGIIICFFYVLLASYLEPLNSKQDQVLQYFTSIQLFCTLISGLMITHRSYEREKGIGNPAQDAALGVWLMFSTIVVFLIIVGVIVSLFTSCKSVKKMIQSKRAKKLAAKNKSKIAPSKVA